MTAVSGDERTRTAAAAIRHHYDVGNDFYRLWLDPSLTYSCALRGPGDDLAAAQDRKLRHHLDAVAAADAGAILDIGCGWGALARLAVSRYRAGRVVGLTLSDEQAEYVRAQALPGVEVRLEDWRDHAPEVPYDGIVSIGAFEHFARPDDTPEARLALYRDFFARCRTWLSEDGTLSLQTIVYGNMRREDASAFMQREIFPDAELPTPAEILTAAQDSFEVVALTNGRLDYAWTCEEWGRRLRARRAEATALVGADTVARYERYLKLSALGFRMGKLALLRLVLRPHPAGYLTARTR
ncbi:SAM-dependent methyltransferase [Nocardia thailandica]|uniref:SAM-dependent methyltransferase n=1 Tax=Nocardia thailandica TaxID=257275 RepID=UPI0002E3F6B4|nr:cyclopropane-fatty-acyl-phospholipid synthase family protein [Nocardia thailandica]